LRSGIEHSKAMLKRIDSEIAHIKKDLEALKHVDSWKGLSPFEVVKVPKDREEQKKLPYYEFTTSGGLKVWVGKNAKANDQLTFRYAKGSDYWLHVADFPGSHIVLRVGKNQEPDPESIQDALQLAIGYSKAKDQGAAEVCVTQCKYVSRLGKNAPGKVQISKHKNLHVKFDPAKFKRIKEGYHS
jgi:predicted ribosome quality control (RQC) complex YloA/Tae2 family protein